MKRSLFLIGGSGFIGKHIVKALHNDYHLTIFDRYIDCEFFSNYPQITTVEIDLVKDKIPDSFSTPDFIINLASVVTAERDLSLFDDLVSTNLKILLNLFARFKDNHRLKLFMQFGSSEEYGNQHSPFRETMREEPNSPYALIKQLTTNTALMLWRNYHFPATVIRPGNLFGEGQPKNKFIPYIIDKLSRNQPLAVTPCRQKRDFIEVTEFAQLISRLLKKWRKCKGEIINVSSGKSHSLRSIIEKHRKLLNSTSEVRYGALPYRPGEAMNLSCDITKLQNILGMETLPK